MSITLVSSIIKQNMDSLTSSEKKIARVILAEYPTAGLQPVAKLSANAKVSAPTVLRFVSKLGIESYPKFQQLLLSELKERRKSALEQYQEQAQPEAQSDLLSHCLSVFQAGLKQSFQELPVSEFDKCIELLSDPKKKINCLGGRYSATLAQYLSLHLKSIRSNCAFISTAQHWSVHDLIDLSKRDVILAYDFRRYQKQTIEYVEEAAKRGASIVLITDRYLSPAAEFSDCVLSIDIKGPSPFDSTLPAMALTEAIIAAMVNELGESARNRVKQIEALDTGFKSDD